MDTIVLEKIKQVKKGNQAAFGDVVQYFEQRIYQHCFRMLGNGHDAEDIAQEAFIRAYVNINRYDENRKFTTWLYRIATNLAIDRMRKRKPDYHLDAEIKGLEGLNMYSNLVIDETLPEEKVIQLERSEYVHKEILALPPKYRFVIMLRYLEEFAVKDISQILNIPDGTVKTRLYRAREVLRKRMNHGKGV